MKTLYFCLFILLTGFTVADQKGCTKDIQIPANDPTPPSVHLSVFAKGEKIDLTTGSVNVFRNLDLDDVISMIASARDENGGVKSVSISGEITTSCTDGEFGQNHYQTLLFDNTDSDKQPGDMAKVSRALAENLRLESFGNGCGPMYWLTSLQGSISVTGRNFHGGTSRTARFEFKVVVNSNWGNLSYFQPDIPQGGRAVAIAVNPTDDRKIIVASETGGLFKTTNGGDKWNRIEHLPKSRVYDVKYAPGNDQIVIATSLADFSLTHKGCIWRSTDGGGTWSSPATAMPPVGNRCAEVVSAYSISFEPGSNRVFVATDCGLAISEDLGTSWTYVLPNPNTPVNNDKTQDRIYSVLSQNGGQLNIAASNGIWSSPNRGATWYQSNTQPTRGNFMANHVLAASPYDPKHVFLAGGRNGLYQSTDAGINWSPVSGLPRPQVYVKGSDGQLGRHIWNGSNWSWTDLGTPENISIVNNPAVVNYENTIHAFAPGSDGNLYMNYYDGKNWQWINQGTPSGTIKIESTPTAITFIEGYSQAVYVFARGSDGNLHVNYGTGMYNWQWKDLGRPNGIPILGEPSAITYRDDVQHIDVFAYGADGHLYANSWDGNGWNWTDHGRMGESYVTSIPSLVTFEDGHRQIYVFVKGIYGGLHARHWDGTNWQWIDLGKPPGGIVITKPSAITYHDGNVQRIYTFVKTNNGRLFVNYWDGNRWQWADQGIPGGDVYVESAPGVITFWEGAQKVYAFVQGTNDHLYVNYWNGSRWQWAHQGQLPGVLVNGTPAAITYDHLGSSNRPVFIKSAKSISNQTNGFDLYYGNGVSLWRQGFLHTPKGPVPNTIWAQLQSDHSDPADVGFDKNNRMPILLATDGGLHKTTNQGFNWTLKGSNKDGYQALQITEIAGQKVTGSNPHTDLYFGTQDNGIKGSSDGGRTWPHSLCCEGFFIRTALESNNHAQTKVSGVACGRCYNFLGDHHLTNVKGFPNPPDGDTLDDGHEGNPIFLQPGYYLQQAINNTPGVPYTHTYYLSKDNGVSWAAKFNIDEQRQEMPRVVGPNTNPTIYLAVRRPGLNVDGNIRLGLKKITNIYGTPVVSDADGTGFGSLGIFPTMFAWYVTFGVSPFDPDFLIMADVDTDEMKVSRDGGLNWEADQKLTNLITSNGAYKFQNGQFTLVDIIAFDPVRPDHILIGTAQNGIIRSIDGGKNWRKVAGSEIIPFISSFYFFSDSEVIVSSYGGGLWKLGFSAIPAKAAVVQPVLVSRFSGPDDPLVVNLQTGNFTRLQDMLKSDQSSDYQFLLVQQGQITDFTLSGNKLSSVNYSKGALQLMNKQQQRFDLSIPQKQKTKIGSFSNHEVLKKIRNKGLPIKGLVLENGIVTGIILSAQDVSLEVRKEPYVYLISSNMLGGIPNVLPGEKVILRGKDFYPSSQGNIAVTVKLDSQLIDQIQVDEQGSFQTELTIKDDLALGDYVLIIEQNHSGKNIKEIVTFKVVVRD